MGLFGKMAGGLVQSMSKEDLEQVMNSAIDRMFAAMDKEERLSFAENMVEKSMVRILDGLDSGERAKLMNSLLPQIMKQFPLDTLGIHPASMEET